MKWEYRTVQYHRRLFFRGTFDSEAFNRKLNVQGKEGWELVNVENMAGWGMTGVIAVFKRQL